MHFESHDTVTNMSMPECDECRAIRQEYTDAYLAVAREVAESLESGDKELAEAWLKARRFLSEEDVILAEQVFPTVRLKSSVPFSLAIRRQLIHHARTGHKLNFRP